MWRCLKLGDRKGWKSSGIQARKRLQRCERPSNAGVGLDKNEDTMLETWGKAIFITK